MTHAYLSDFSRLTQAQLSSIDHWIIDDPDRPDLKTYDHNPSTADISHDIDLERREGWLK